VKHPSDWGEPIVKRVMVQLELSSIKSIREVSLIEPNSFGSGLMAIK
jgi:hypothetical protein